MTLSPTNPRAKPRWLALIVSVALLTAFVGSAALAVHDDGNIQLDRNAFTSDTENAATPPGQHDWDQVYDPETYGPHGADSASFVADGIGPTIFTGGGSKDLEETTSWKHKSGNVPDKDELLNAYAARYGDNVYFGADRYSNSGDAVMGFWFFQADVQALPDGSFGPGMHTVGDVLLLSDFTGGGGNTTIRVFQWHGVGDVRLIAGTTATPADCVGPPGVPNDDPFCATVNQTAKPSPWPFQAKSGAANIFPPGHFFEGGIDLAFLDLGGECFASFLAETRSSTSLTATLKDFVGGSFESCDSDVTTTPSDADGNPLTSITIGQSIHDSALIVGSGSSIAPTGTMNFYICSPSQLTNGACETGGTEVNGPDAGSADPAAVTPVPDTSNSTSISDAFTPTSIGTWCWRGEYSGDANYPPATDASTGECFTVTDIASTTTAQKWLPNDTATVTAAGGSTIAGTVTFSLYENGNCSGTAVQTFPNRPVDSSGVAESNNTTYYTDARTISWRAVFTSTNNVASGSASHCETMTVSVLNNDLGS